MAAGAEVHGAESAVHEMTMAEELFYTISPHEMFRIKLFGLEIPVSDTVIVMWFVMALIIIVAVIITRSLNTIPNGKQHIAEMYVDFVSNFAKGNIGHHGVDFVPYLGTIFLFLVFANAISIFNFFPGAWIADWTGIESLRHFGIRPPTRDINVTMCLALMSIVLTLGAGIKYKKFSGWLKYLVDPVPIILPFKLLDYFIRPLSLCFRLFGNILGAFIVMELLLMAIPAFLPAVFSIYFDLFDAILQAYVFCFLTSLYIAEAIE